MEENNCIYINSRGLLKSCDIFSNNPVSSIKYILDYDWSKCKDGSVVYICSSAIKHFITLNIPYKIILVSGDCDETCWNDIFAEYDDFIKFIESDKIIKWYSQNCIVSHSKLKQIPIGLDYHTIAKGNIYWGEKKSPKEQELEIEQIRSEMKPFWEREIKCYSNFHFNIVYSKFGYDRIDAIKQIPNKLMFYEKTFKTRKESFITQSKFAFVISPHGNGLDCHRTWEALVLGNIPIVKTSGIDNLYKDLPVLIVNEWSDITYKLLNHTINEFKTMEFNYKKLHLSYWNDIIRNEIY